MEYQVLVLNEIAPAGLKVFGDRYITGTAWDDPDAIVVRSAPVDTDRYQKLLAVGRAGAGVDTITVDKATERGICVFNTPGANANAVAELVFIMVGVHARRVHQALAYAEFLSHAESDWAVRMHVEQDKARFTGFELSGKTLGVIGLGNVGIQVANRGLRDGMQVVGFDAFPTLANMHALDARARVMGRMDDVLGCADVLTVHVPLLEATRGLIGTNEISRLKDGCIVVNYAREEICDERAILTALESGAVSAYVTDFPTHALLRHNRVLCTPHLGASTSESAEKSAVMAATHVRNYIEYGIVEHAVNFPTVDKMPSQTARSRLSIVNRDVPAMIGKIAGVLGKAGVNIQKMINESNGVIGYNVVDLETALPARVAERIKKIPGVLRVRCIGL